MFSLLLASLISSVVTTAIYKGFVWVQDKVFGHLGARLQWAGEGPEPLGVFVLRLSVVLVIILIWVVILLFSMVKLAPVLAPLLGVRG